MHAQPQRDAGLDLVKLMDTSSLIEDGIESPRVSPNRKSKGSKRVDIALAADMHCSRNAGPHRHRNFGCRRGRLSSASQGGTERRCASAYLIR